MQQFQIQKILQNKILSKIFAQLTRQKDWLIFGLLVSVSCIIALLYYISYSSSDEVTFLDHLYNAEHMYIHVFFKDIFEKSGSIQDWHVALAPSFIPDYFLFLFAYIFSGNAYIQNAIYMVLQIIAFAGVILFALRQITTKEISFITTASIIAFFVWLVILYGQPFIYLFINSYHFGIIILSVLNIALWLKYKQSNNINYFLAIIFVCFVGAFSDAHFLPQSIAPLAVTIMLSAILFKDTPIRKAAILSFCVTMAGILGYFSLSLVPAQLRKTPAIPDLKGMGQELIRLFDFMGQHFISLPILSFILMIFTFIIIKQFYILLLKKNQLQQNKFDIILQIYVILTIAGAMGFILLFSTVHVADRYLIPLLIFPTILVFLSLYNSSKFANPRFHLCIFLAISMLSVGTLIPRINKNGLHTNYYPDYLACIDEALGQTSLSNGIASYWGGKHIQAFSKLDLTLAQYITDNLTVFPRVTSGKYYRDSYDFAIINNFKFIASHRILGHSYRLFKDKVINFSGNPKQIKECGGWTVMVYGKDGLLSYVEGTHRWQACQLYSNIVSSCNEATGARSASQGKAGHLTYGPYTRMSSGGGRYNFEIRYSSTDAPSLQAGTWDVVLAHQGGQLSAGQLTGTNGDISTIDGEFTMAEKDWGPSLEIRTFKHQPSQLTIYDIAITKID